MPLEQVVPVRIQIGMVLGGGPGKVNKSSAFWAFKAIWRTEPSRKMGFLRGFWELEAEIETLKS